MNGQSVTFAMGEAWCWDDTLASNPTTDYQVIWAHQYLSDGARQRFLDIELDPGSLRYGPIADLARTWTDYDGNQPYRSRYTDLTAGANTETGYELGLARINDLAGTPSTDYYHTDMLGTTRFMTNVTSEMGEQASYTAFGERVTGTPTRFGYVGAFGYQTAGSSPGDPFVSEMPYQHVGARYYDPTTGRFLQRDPIGIRGGLNSYSYVGSLSTLAVDPPGTDRWLMWSGWWHAYAVIGNDDIGYTAVDFASANWSSSSIGWMIWGVIKSISISDRGRRTFTAAGRPPRAPDTTSSSSRDRKLLQRLRKKSSRYHLLGANCVTDSLDIVYGDASSNGGDRYICFVAGTPIRTQTRTVPIEEVAIGAQVLTKDLRLGEIVPARVLRSRVTGQATELMSVQIAGEEFQSTRTHPYWVKGRGWTPARLLRVGDELETVDGAGAKVERIREVVLESPVPIYDLTIQGTHNYYIGRIGVLVHNS